MRVLYVSHFGGLGGAERSLLEVMTAVRSNGVTPLLVCPDGPLSAAAAAIDIPVAAWDASPLTRGRGPRSWSRSLPRLVRGWRSLDRTVRRLDPDILHVNSAQAMLWCGPLVGRRLPPIVWHWRDFCGSRAFSRVMARGSDAVVVVSDAMMRFARGMLGPLADRVVLARNGIADLPPRDEGAAADLRRSMGFRTDAPLVVMAGQSIPRKGHAVLLDALARLAAERRRLSAWLICAEHDAESRAYTEWLRQRAAALEGQATVRVTSGVDRIAPVMQVADIVAVPSLREPFGRIAVEAMLAERPVVASAVDGLEEIVDDEATGRLVPPGDSARLAAALADVIDRPLVWSARGRAARQRALRLFSVSRVAEELAAIYQRVRSNGRGH
jgi:glycosyltransferase involved in cell wall biosynthesis